MARNPSSSHRSSRDHSGPRVRSDGKVDVFCPQCGCQYRVNADALDQKIQCQDCKRTFFAKSGAGKRPKPPDHSKVYLGFGIGAVVIIAIFVISSGGGKEPAKPVETPVVVSIDLAQHPRARNVRQWMDAVKQNGQLTLRTTTDLGAIQTQLAVPGRAFAQTMGNERDELEKAIFTALQTSEETLPMREMATTSQKLVDDAAATGDTGAAIIYLAAAADSKVFDWKRQASYVVRFRANGDQIQVTGWELRDKPRSLVPSGPIVKVHDKIEKPKEVEITDSAGTRKVAESPPIALEHLPEVSEADRKKIDDLVAMLLKSADPEAPGALFNRATDGLMAIGRPAVARILNAMYEQYGDVNANAQRISQLDRALRQVSGMSVNFQIKTSGEVAKDKAERESVVRQWFAWWYRYANGEFDELIDKENTLDAAPKKK